MINDVQMHDEYLACVRVYFCIYGFSSELLYTFFSLSLSLYATKEATELFLIGAENKASLQPNVEESELWS